MLTKTLSEAKKKQRNIMIKAMNNDIGSIDSAKDSWNPAQISERAKDISYIRSLVDSWNPAQLNEALKMLDLPVIDTWNPAQIEEQRRNLVFYLAERTLTGNTITIKILGNLTPEVTGLKVTMNPIQIGSGDPSPTNIRPISGRTEASVKRTGVNIIDIDNAYNFEKYNGGTCNGFNIKNIEGTFTISGNGNTDAVSYAYKNNQGAWREGSLLTTETSETFTTYGEIQIWCGNNIKSKAPKLQLEFGSTASAYSPYTAETHTHQYSETIYGGVDDFVNGGLTNEYGFVDLGTLTYTYVSNLQAFYTDGVASTIKRTANDAEIPTWLYSSAYKQSAVNDTILGRNNGRISVASNGRVWISNFDYTDATAFKSALDGITLCYGLATPTTISTSAEEITLLKGTNVLSTDGDSIELKYKQNF